MGVQISPSLLAADFSRLADEAAAVADTADWLYVYVMDTHFVPNLTLGLPAVEGLLKHATLPVDCHLMIDDPDRWAPAYAEVVFFLKNPPPPEARPLPRLAPLLR